MIEEFMFNIKEFNYDIINIEVTNHCNMRCTFCALPIRDAKDKEMETKDVTKILHELSKYEGIDFVAFHQFGEPILHPDLWKYIDLCKELGLRTQLVTNGLGLTKKNIENIINHSPDILRISLHVLDPLHHMEIRGIKVPFEKYIDRVSNCLSALIDHNHKIQEIRTDVAVNDDRNRGLKRYIGEKTGGIDTGDPTILNQTVHKLKPRITNLLKEIERKSRSFVFSEKHFTEMIEKYYVSSPKGGGLHDEAYIIEENNFLAYKSFWNGRKLSTFYPIESATCSTETIGILADGTVTLCCIDYEGFTGLGNIHEESLEKILNRNRSILTGLRETGDLHFETCKKCLGAPTKIGVTVKKLHHFWRNKIYKYLSKTSKEQLPWEFKHDEK